MIDVAHGHRILAEYRAQGFVTALDDFGAGDACLNLLARFQPDYIKIDLELFRGVATSRARQIIIACVLTMARELDVAVIAEGIETEAELTALRAAGITLFQGYLFAKPAIASLPSVRFSEPDNLMSMKAAQPHGASPSR